MSDRGAALRDAALAVLILLVSGVVALAGCGDRRRDDATPRLEATREVLRTLTSAHWAAFQRAEFDDWAGMCALDAFLLDTDPTRVVAGRDSIRVAARGAFAAAFDRGLSVGVSSNAFATGLTPALDAAWLSDELDVTYALDGNRESRTVRFTGVAENGPRGWRLTLLDYSCALPDSDAMVRAATGRLPPPAAVGDAVAEGADELAKRYRRALGGKRAPAFANREDVVALGPSGERGFGPVAAREVLDAWWKAGERPRLVGAVRARVGAAGSLGWVAGNVERSRDAGGRSLRVPYRMVCVYWRDGRAWRLVQAHVGYAVPDPFTAPPGPS